MRCANSANRRTLRTYGISQSLPNPENRGEKQVQDASQPLPAGEDSVLGLPVKAHLAMPSTKALRVLALQGDAFMGDPAGTPF